MSTDLLKREEFPSFAEPAPAAAAPESDEVDGLELPPVERVSAPVRPRQPQQGSHFELSANAIDLNALFGEAEAPRAAPAAKPKAHAAQESVEVDLSIVLGEFGTKPRSPAAAPATGPPAPQPLEAGDIDSVFEHLRDEASKQSTGDAEEYLRRGMTLRQQGKIDESIAAFEMASHSPRHRFQAATLIGRTHRGRGQLPQAIEWFERAAQAPAPSAEEEHMLLYELADALETAGEVARALAICMKLQATAPEFRDVAARVDRLNKVQTRG